MTLKNREIEVGLCFVFVAVITNMHLQTFFIFWRISARRHLQSAPPISCFEQRGLRPLDRSSSRDSRKLTSLDPLARIPDRLQHQRRCRRSVTLNEFTKGCSARPDPPFDRLRPVLVRVLFWWERKRLEFTSTSWFQLAPDLHHIAVVSSQQGEGHWRHMHLLHRLVYVGARLPGYLCVCVCVHVCLYMCVCTDACMIVCRRMCSSGIRFHQPPWSEVLVSATGPRRQWWSTRNIKIPRAIKVIMFIPLPPESHSCSFSTPETVMVLQFPSPS